jgi:hypothetical protein
MGATLVVALLADAEREPGDHKGRPYIMLRSFFTTLRSDPFRLAEASAYPQYSRIGLSMSRAFCSAAPGAILGT